MVPLTLLLLLGSSLLHASARAADDFYSNPSNLSDYAVGDLIRWEDVPSSAATNIWSIPAGMSLSRFLYLSEDVDGKPIPATAVVLLPYSNPLSDKPLRTVAWTHGTAGATRQCAPSNNKVLYYDWQGPFILAQQGYAVIAPDYAGQGSDIPQGFMYESGALHAHDTSHAVQVARQHLQGIITHEWVVAGHSEGGLTAWRTNEREANASKAIGGFLGSVSQAPALRSLSLMPESWRRAGDGPIGDVVSVYVLQSYARLFPEIRVEDYATQLVLDRIPLSDNGCLRTGVALFSNLTVKELYKNTSWVSHPTILNWDKRYNGVGPHKLAAPMMIIQGEADILTYPETMEEDFNRTCEAYPESTVDLRLYPELDHDAAAQAGIGDYLPWIADRFNNKTITTGCRKQIVKPITNRFGLVQHYWEAVGH